MTASAALALALLACPARAADEARGPELRDMPPAAAAPGWTRQGSSLLLYDESGSLSQELPLKAPDPSGPTSRETLGGVSPDGRLAWTLDRRQTWNQGRTRLLESRRQLRVYGTGGQEVWRDDSVDVPERGGEPLLFSADGRSLLLSRRAADGWYAEVRSWMGQVLASLGPYPRLDSMALTPNGRYALARWSVPDKSDTHTFLDVAAKAVQEVPSGDLVLGLARIGDDGVVRSGSRVVLSFAPPPAAPAAPAPR